MNRKSSNDRQNAAVYPETEQYYQRVAQPVKPSPDQTALEQMYGYYDAL